MLNSNLFFWACYTTTSFLHNYQYTKYIQSYTIRNSYYNTAHNIGYYKRYYNTSRFIKYNVRHIVDYHYIIAHHTVYHTRYYNVWTAFWNITSTWLKYRKVQHLLLHVSTTNLQMSCYVVTIKSTTLWLHNCSWLNSSLYTWLNSSIIHLIKLHVDPIT